MRISRRLLGILAVLCIGHLCQYFWPAIVDDSMIFKTKLDRSVTEKYSDTEEEPNHPISKSSDPTLEEIVRVKQMLKEEPSVDNVIQNLTAIFVKGLKSADPKIQMESIYSLINIAHKDDYQATAVVDAVAISYFIQLLSSTDQNIVEKALEDLKYIIGHGGPYRQHLSFQLSIIETLIKLIASKPSLGVRRELAKLLAELAGGENFPADLNDFEKLLPVLKLLLQEDDVETLSFTLWGIAEVVGNMGDYPQSVIDAGMVPIVLPLIKHEHVGVWRPAMNLIHSIAGKRGKQAKAVLDAGVLDYVPYMFSHSFDLIQCQAYRMVTILDVSDLTTEIDAHLDADLLSKVRGLEKRCGNRRPC